MLDCTGGDGELNVPTLCRGFIGRKGDSRMASLGSPSLRSLSRLCAMVQI